MNTLAKLLAFLSIISFCKCNAGRHSRLVACFISNGSSCGSSLPGSEGSFTHPEFPQDYGSNANCEWSTSAKDRDKVFFDFELLDLEIDRNGGCTYDYVSIKFPSENQPEKFCGLANDRPADKEFKTNGTGNPEIKFISDDSVQHKGFNVRFRIERYDYCQSSPCENEATCVLDETKDSGWRCDCAPGWDGPTCGDDADECESGPCENGGTCTTPDFNMHQCSCVKGYSGENCEIDINDCESDPCNNGGRCVDGVDQYTCECTSGFIGDHCQTELNECDSDPCQNGGSCEDAIDTFHCQCRDGFEGTRCETETDECESNPCSNGGTCVDEVGGFRCLCIEGFDGETCESDDDECLSAPCENGGTCSDEINGFVCFCRSGFTGTGCEIDIDECDSSPCFNGAPCVDHPGAYECICNDGFVGQNCDSDYNECESRPCLNGGECEDFVNNFTCACLVGYTGYQCEINIDDCEEEPCLNEGSCVDETNGYHCLCMEGYKGLTCEDGTEAERHRRSHILSAVLPSLLFLLVIILLALAFFAFLRKKRNYGNRVRVVKVKPAETRHSKKMRKSFKPSKRKHKHRSSSVKRDIDSDVVSVIDHYIEPTRPSAFVGQISNGFGNPIPTEPQESMARFSASHNNPPPAFPTGVTGGLMQPGMFHGHPGPIYTYPAPNLENIPLGGDVHPQYYVSDLPAPHAQASDMNSYNPYVNPSNPLPEPQRAERNYLNIPTDELYEKPQKKYYTSNDIDVNDKYRRLDSAHDTCESRLGSKESLSRDLSSNDSCATQFESQKTSPALHPKQSVNKNHMRDRISKVNRRSMTTRQDYTSESEMDVESPRISLNRRVKPISTNQDVGVRRSLKNWKRRKSGERKSVQRQKTNFFPRKKRPGHITFDTSPALSAITGDKTIEKMHRHPPEGGVCPSTNETSHSKDTEQDRAKKDKPDARQPSRASDQSFPLFKLIKNRKQLGINKGWGFNRENAFVQ